MPAPTLSADEHFQLALDHLTRRRLAESLAHFHHAEGLGHEADQCCAGRWECSMLSGDFEQAWRETDAIRLRGQPDPHRFWDGSNFAGKRVILRCLHGYGDAIQFIRYAPLIRRDAARLVVETHAELVSLFEPLPYIDQVITWGASAPDPAPEWDAQIEIMELLHAFRTTRESIPNTVPYLRVTPERAQRSRAHMETTTDLRRVGLLWASSKWNPARSLRLEQLTPILRLPGFAFYSFQRGPERDQLQSLDGAYRIHDTASHSPEIADTAADIGHIDVMITVDTMAAHLAGALAKPVWTLLPYEADWRWMSDREDTPWYPTMRLFRQPSPGDWDSVMARVVSELLR